MHKKSETLLLSEAVLLMAEYIVRKAPSGDAAAKPLALMLPNIKELVEDELALDALDNLGMFITDEAPVVDPVEPAADETLQVAAVTPPPTVVKTAVVPAVPPAAVSVVPAAAVAPIVAPVPPAVVPPVTTTTPTGNTQTTK